MLIRLCLMWEGLVLLYRNFLFKRAKTELTFSALGIAMKACYTNIMTSHITHHTCNPNAFYAHNIKMENESPTLVYILFLIIHRLQSIRLRNQRIHRRQILFVFLDRITRRRQWMFLALQQNIMEQRERGIVRRLDFTKTLITMVRR